MKHIIFGILLLAFNLGFAQTHSTKKVYQNDTLIGIEKYNEQGQITFQKGVIGIPDDQAYGYQRQKQYFYDDEGNLSITVEGADLETSTIEKYYFEDNECREIERFTYPNLWTIPVFQYSLFVVWDPVGQFSNRASKIVDTIWYSLDEVKVEMDKRQSSTIYRKTQFNQQTYEHHYWQSISFNSGYGYPYNNFNYSQSLQSELSYEITYDSLGRIEQVES